MTGCFVVGNHLAGSLIWKSETINSTYMFYRFLFPQHFRGRGVSILILFLRLFFGILFFTHGLGKMMNFSELSVSYPDVLGFGSYMSLMVTIFCEFCCSLFLIVGLLVRIMVIPMIVAMAVAFFDVHDAILSQGELSLIYLVVFVILYFLGPGRYSFDYLIDMKFQKDKSESTQES
jgi:putative oxidoreductase